MPFKFIDTEIEGIKKIEPHIFSDDRGLYIKYYEKNVFRENGILSEFNETSDQFSNKGSLRGLHYQTKDSQAKLIHMISGEIFDVAIDLRKNSKTFGKYHAELLSDKNKIALYIPEGFAHGYIALSDNTIFSYQCSETYLPQYCGGIRWNDEDLSIPWPLKEYKIDTVIATEKDKSWPTLKEYIDKYGI